MSEIYVVAGRRMNQLARSVETPTGSARPGYELEWAYDSDPVRPLLMASGTQSNAFGLNLNQIPNGDFEEPFINNLPSGWSCIGPSPATRYTADKAEGDASLRVSGSGKNVFYDHQVAAGEYLSAYAQAKNSGGVGACYAQNLMTNMYLQPDGTWGANRNPWHVSGAAWDAKKVTFQVEDFDACGEEPTIRWIFEASPAISASALFDAFVVFPRIDIAILVGHNVPPSVALQLQASKDDPFDSGKSEKIDVPHSRHTTHVEFDPLDLMLWELTYDVGRPDGRSMYFGEIILGQKLSLQRRFDAGVKVETALPQDRPGDDMFGSLRVYPRAAHPRRRMSMNFSYFDDESWREMMTTLERTRNGADAAVIIPDIDDPGSAIYGRVNQSVDWTHSSDQAENRKMGIVFDELPLPNIYPDDPEGV